VLRLVTTHTYLRARAVGRDPAARQCAPLPQTRRLRAQLASEAGFTLLEVLTVTIIIGVLAALALALFLNQRERAHDGNAKSDVTNVSRLIQACNADEERDNYRDCDSAAEIDEPSLPIDATPASDAESGDCDPPGSATVGDGSVRIVQSGKRCFTVLAGSSSGNRFWIVKHDDGSISRDCKTHGVSGCPASGIWGG
jgi:prepilin-type N-terminal cleavage/methylation domain-containing protein